MKACRFRWRIRQRLAVSCPQPGVAARVARTACMSKAGWRDCYYGGQQELKGDVQQAQDAADRLGVKLIVFNATNEDEIDASFATMIQKGAGAVLVTSDS